jgi:cytochrome c oxidase assembly factor CtaG
MTLAHFLFDAKTLFLLLAMLIIIMVIANGQLLENLESDLGTHMIVEHAMFFSIGYISILAFEGILRGLFNTARQRSAASYTTKHSIWIQTLLISWMRFVRSAYIIASNGLILIICAIILVAFWHIPSIFDLSSYSQEIHLLQHFSFVMVGALFLLSLRQLGQSLVLFLIISSVGMMLLSGLGLALANERLYLPYSVSSHNTAGEYMLAISIAIALIGLPGYLIRRTLFHVGKLANNKSELNS